MQKYQSLRLKIRQLKQRIFKNLESLKNNFILIDILLNYIPNLVYHFRVHTKEKPFKWDKCPKSFTQNSNLKKHIVTHLLEGKNSKKVFEWDLCSKRYSSIYYLRVRKLLFILCIDTQKHSSLDLVQRKMFKNFTDLK